MPFPRPIPAWLIVEDATGRTMQRVDMIGETPTRVFIRALARTRLADGWLEAGQIALVSRRTLRIASVGATTRGEVVR